MFAERLTARVLLFDAANRILLMKGRLPDQPNRPGEWFTVGGGVEPGETLAQAAIREIQEESGIEGVRLGPVVWRRELVVEDRNGRPVMFNEHYLVAHCQDAVPRRQGWTDLERSLVDDIRWWSLSELEMTSEPLHPPGLVARLGDIIAGRYPAVPLLLAAG